jgi:uncharacterized repeat protein (TIGR01451 family)
MIVKPAFSRVLFGLFLLLLSCLLVLKLKSSANETTSKPVTPQPARLGDRVAIHAAGRGNPTVNLSDGRDVVAQYLGSADAVDALQNDLAQPLALTSADFDEDGVPDLICSYAGPNGGIATLYRGNADSISPNSPEAQRHKAAGTFTNSPLLSPARVFELPQQADFVAAGDFDADGHVDLLIGKRGGSRLYILRGDGKGSPGSARQIDLPGPVTALTTGEMNRVDGLIDIAVSVVSQTGPQVLIFQGGVGAVNAQPEVVPLPAQATAMALGSLRDNHIADLAIAAGRELLIVHGRDRTLESHSEMPSTSIATITRRPLDFSIRSLAIGHFSDVDHASLALLSQDGTLHLLSSPQTTLNNKFNKPVELWRDSSLATGSHATDFVRTRTAGTATDSLVLVDSSAHKLHVVAGEAYSKQENSESLPSVLASLDLEDEAVAVLPIQLNWSAFNDLVVLKKGRSAPSVVTPQSMMTFTVITSGDTLGSGSLRDAITNANANPGPDLIIFQIPPGGPVTINLSDTLPTISDPVTIDATTQPGFAGSPIVELNGAGAGAGADGLDIIAGSTSVRGLVINRFSNSGIALDNAGANLVQGNFIGTNLAGDAALGNSQGGVTVTSTDNTIGGLATGLGNVISGNTLWGINLAASNNRVQGNSIGTNAAGSMSITNNADGVVIANLASNNTIGGISARNIISGNSGNGINIGGGAQGTIVQSNFIGVDINGVAAVGNGAGVHISGSSGNTIGGGANGGGNVISGNSLPPVPVILRLRGANGRGNVISGNVGVATGVLIDAGSSANTVARNFIGTNATGTAGIPNSGDGILVQDSPSNIIGGVGGGLGNVVSGGNFIGIEIAGNASSSNRVQGNFVGTNASGNGALGNQFEGVFINGAPNNVIGGASAGNVLSGNGAAATGHEGLRIVGVGSTGNVVQGNFVGTNASGSAAIPNSGSGMLLVDLGTGAPSKTIIGGTSAASRNVFSGNASHGIRLNNTAAPTNVSNNTVQGNFIGTAADGATPLGNTNNGVTLGNAAGNTIGGSAASAGNVIAFNGRDGVAAEAGIGNSILSNSIYSNTLLGIDLGDDGVTPNDAGDGDVGANNLQNFPVLTSVDSSFGSTVIQGSLNSTPNSTFTVQFFSNTTCNASGFGEGQHLIGATVVTTDAKGNANISFTAGGTFAPPVTATATDASGNTSEFSACATASGVDLAVTISASPNPVAPGDRLTYSITAINKGTVAAINVTVTDNLPASVSFISCSSNGGGACLGSGNLRLVGFSALLPGTSATITLVTRVNQSLVSGTVISNTATISSNVVDVNPLDNIAMTSTVVSTSPPALACPSHIFQNIDSGKCTAVVSYPPPVANLPGLNLIINCSPPSGSTFPVGDTAVDCLASDAKGLRASCSFFITVTAPVSASVALEGGGPVLDLGPATAQRKTKKPPKGCTCARIFTIQNNGCASFGLAPPSIHRIGSDVTNGKIANPDDSNLFSLRLVLADGSELPVPCGPMCFITSEPGQTLTFRVLFKPGIPAYSGKTNGLSSVDVLPDTFSSQITFNLNTTPPSASALAINVVAHVSTDVQIINPDNARGPKLASFTKSGDEFNVTFGVFDSDLDVNKARFEFLDSNGNLVDQAFDVDITQPISKGNIIKGQSFVVVQKFTGAKDHPEVAAVRVTVSDAHSSDSVTAQLGSSATSASVIQSLQNRAPLVELPERQFQLHP